MPLQTSTGVRTTLTGKKKSPHARVKKGSPTRLNFKVPEINIAAANTATGTGNDPIPKTQIALANVDYSSIHKAAFDAFISPCTVSIWYFELYSADALRSIA
jgi:hypothetical protein